MMHRLLLTTLCWLTLAACGTRGAANQAAAESAVTPAAFDADSALQYVGQQVQFGPRVPGSPAHNRCAEWIIEKLKQFGARVDVQRMDVALPDGMKMSVVNILGRFPGTDSLAAPILLVAHYDTRPWADEDPDPANHNKPVPGANDGGSGVGVLLETARQLSLQPPPIPVDLLFVDLEDSGTSGGGEETTDTWCRGTQAWVADGMPYGKNGQPWPRYGILLDMVGGAGAVFPREYYSTAEARDVVVKVWNVAKQAGLEERFPNRAGGAVIDDHLWLTRAGIPTVDIIESMNPQTGSFPPTWHTLQDDMSGIDAQTLKAVGVLVNTVIRQEK